MATTLNLVLPAGQKNFVRSVKRIARNLNGASEQIANELIEFWERVLETYHKEMGKDKYNYARTRLYTELQAVFGGDYFQMSEPLTAHGTMDSFLYYTNFSHNIPGLADRLVSLSNIHSFYGDFSEFGEKWEKYSDDKYTSVTLYEKGGAAQSVVKDLNAFAVEIWNRQFPKIPLFDLGINLDHVEAGMEFYELSDTEAEAVRAKVFPDWANFDFFEN